MFVVLGFITQTAVEREAKRLSLARNDATYYCFFNGALHDYWIADEELKGYYSYCAYHRGQRIVTKELP